MAGNAKPALPGRASHKNKTNRYPKYNTKAAPRQAPIPGTALAAFLKKYRADLLACELTREVSQALDCVDGLLMLVEVKP